MSQTGLPTQARIVVVGGGIIGCSVAYHLAKMGCRDVVLLERDRITSGTTWHAAGLMVTFGSTSETSTEMRKYTRDLWGKLEEETGLETGFKPVGFIECAAGNDRLEEFRRVAAFNRLCGVDVHEIGPSEVKSLFPLAKTEDIDAGFYVPTDGRVNPVDATVALAKGARLGGVRIFEETPATGVLTRGGAVTGVRTAKGDIQSEFVVNCCGMWARQFGELAGVNVPLQAAEHYYLITDKMPGIQAHWPILEDPSSYGYYREEVGGLMIGLFEPLCAPWKVDGIPQDFSFGEIRPDWDRMGPFLEKAMSRVPASVETGIKKFFCGPESFTADLRPVVGEAPELKNYFVAAGLNSIGILTGGGLGRLLAHWILTGRPDADVTGIHIDRLHRYQSNPLYRRERTAEMLGMVYRCHYPTMSPQAARGAKRSPIHDRLLHKGAYFKDVSGWEGADWYAGAGQTPDPGPLGWGRQSWFETWREEHEAARNGVILMDMSFMSKFLVQGRDAGRVLEYLSANEVDGDVGTITYTQWLNELGGLEADLTVSKLAAERYLVVATDTMHRHVETWMKHHIGPQDNAFVTDVTGAYAQLNVQGPRSRELLQALTSADCSNEAMPYRAVREIDIGYARVICVRITYLGELGYELYVPAEQALHVYDFIVEKGEAVGLRHAGLKALGSLRIEKGYRDYGHDLDNLDSVWEAGLGFAVALDKGDFLGREAALAQKAKGPLKRRLVQVRLLDPEPLMFHAEVVWCGDKRVGNVRSASYGFTLGGATGLAMIERDEPVVEPWQAWIDAQTWTVEVTGTRWPAVVSIRPMYDPGMGRIKA